MENKKEAEVKPVIMNTFDEKKGSFFTLQIILAISAAIVLGIVTGFIISRQSTSVAKITTPAKGSEVSKGAIVGSNDTKTFKDSAEGVLEEGGIEGEGQYHLVRPGGDSQNVYLTSSTVDLGQYKKKKVKVWGATQTAKSAGWLMDVGRLEVL